jgi:3-oxoacyl-[acyl-carrier protein] reductase
VDLGLAGKVAIIGGASKGLGHASALALAREGARLTISARTAPDLEQAAADIRAETGADVLAVPADLNTAAGIHTVVEATAERFGGIDVLVVNSGGPSVGRFADLTDDHWRAGLEAVTLNFVRFVREVVPYMRASGWGRIITIQSSSVKQPVAGIDLSNGLRPGIAGLAKAIMPDLARDGITVNVVLPGRFRTERVLGRDSESGQSLEELLAAAGSAIPIGRLGEPSELGNLVAFLASEQASYITGSCYQVDGGIIGSNV